MLTSTVMSLTGAIAFNSYADVGVRENTVANLYASVDGKADTNANHFDAKINWGDDTNNKTKADLVYVGTSGSKAHFLVKGTYNYRTQGTNLQTTVTVTGPGGTAITGNGCRTSVYPMPSGLPGVEPKWDGITFKPPANVQVEMTGTTSISSFAGVGFVRNVAANFYVTLNGTADTNINNVHAQINWGDSSDWSPADLVYMGTTANKAQYQVKGSHVYAQANEKIPIVVYATGVDGTSISRDFRSVTVSPMPSGIAGQPPADVSIPGPAKNVLLQLQQFFPVTAFAGVRFQDVLIGKLYASLNGKPDNRQTDVHAQINWGDNDQWTQARLVMENITPDPRFAVFDIYGDYVYNAPSGQLPIVIYATGADGASISAKAGTANVLPSAGAKLGDAKSLRLDQNKPGAIEIPINGGTAPYGNLKVSGLPTGLLAELVGNLVRLSGTPTNDGVFDVGISVTDSRGSVINRTYRLGVAPPLNVRIAEWSQSVLYKRVGGGECVQFVDGSLA